MSQLEMAYPMRGRTVLITGSTDGIGRQTALRLAQLGAEVLLHGRDRVKGRVVQEDIRRKTGNHHLDLFVADLSSQSQVQNLAAQVKESHSRLHVLINNAGVFMAERQLTENGLETTFAVNHLAPFLLTLLLLDLLRKSAPAGIINISSAAHGQAALDWSNLQGERCFDGYQAYALSKLGNVLFTYELAERLKGTKITVNCLHPGAIDTKLLRSGWRDLDGGRLEKGAETPVYLATSSALEKVNGLYFENKRPSSSSALSRDRELQKKFWRVSERLVGMWL